MFFFFNHNFVQERCHVYNINVNVENRTQYTCLMRALPRYLASLTKTKRPGGNRTPVICLEGSHNMPLYDWAKIGADI